MGNKFLNYERDRDYPAIDGTSRLSAHLNAGTLSIRSAVRTALQAGPDGQKWLDELIWREFYFAWFEAEPSMVDLEMNPSMREIEWSHDRDRLERWREGSTGFPIVDAAMRCLHQTGWLHNRLRMVAASFLIKDLLVDWREGRDWFARQLVDHDAAQNAGGWQWCASTGFDAQPWFRIFNPENQSRKFDPDSAFTKRWCPELADCEPERIHLMHCGGDRPAKYPPNVVDHRQQRELALRTLRPRRQAGALN
jgi:deoxyribodipyrimidine photo-lyase